MKLKDLEDMVYRMELAYDEIVAVLDVRSVTRSSIGYTLPPGIYEIGYINLMLKTLLNDG